MPEQNARLIALYQKQAKNYDQSGIHGLDTLRREAVKRLELKRGDLVVDIGCGTGLNFRLSSKKGELVHEYALAAVCSPG